jgi:hypothetical protein
MLSLAVGLAVMMLCGFHIYLTLTSQTTIEFHGKWTLDNDRGFYRKQLLTIPFCVMV